MTQDTLREVVTSILSIIIIGAAAFTIIAQRATSPLLDTLTGAVLMAYFQNRATVMAQNGVNKARQQAADLAYHTAAVMSAGQGRATSNDVATPPTMPETPLPRLPGEE